MHPAPDREVPARARAADVQAVATGKPRLVVVGRPEQQQHVCTRWQVRVADRRVALDLALDRQHWRAEAQELLDRGWDQTRIPAQRFPLLAVSKQLQKAGCQQAGGCLVAGGQLAKDQGVHLGPPDRLVAALVLTDEIAWQIVA